MAHLPPASPGEKQVMGDKLYLCMQSMAFPIQQVSRQRLPPPCGLFWGGAWLSSCEKAKDDTTRRRIRRFS